MTTGTLSRRELNRATLARQLLLERETMTPVKAIERLVALQAQLARPPHIGLWSRVLAVQAGASSSQRREERRDAKGHQGT